MLIIDNKLHFLKKTKKLLDKNQFLLPFSHKHFNVDISIFIFIYNWEQSFFFHCKRPNPLYNALKSGIHTYSTQGKVLKLIERIVHHEGDVYSRLHSSMLKYLWQQHLPFLIVRFNIIISL